MSECYLKFATSARTSGLIAELGAERWHTLTILASFMDESGACYPSIETIAKAMGTSARTAQRRVKALCEFKWNGKPLVERALAKDGGAWGNYTYFISPESGFSPYDTNVALSISSSNNKSNDHYELLNDSTTSMTCTSKDILHYWCDGYLKTYQIPYVPHYGRECPMIKRKLLDPLGASRTKQIIDAVFAFYAEKWATPQFPRPTIGQLCSWLANKAAAYADTSADFLEKYDESVESDGGAQPDYLDYQTMKERGLL